MNDTSKNELMSLAERLVELEFTPQQGLYLATERFVLEASPARRRRGRVCDLELRLWPRATSDELLAGATGACQEAMADPNPGVRVTARNHLVLCEQLAMAREDLQDLAGLPFRLTQRVSQTQTVPREAETDASGRALFVYLLRDVPCRLALAAPKPRFELAPEAQGVCSIIEVNCQPTEWVDAYAAELQVNVSEDPAFAAEEWQVYLRSGKELFMPRRLTAGPSSVRVRFERLEARRFTVEVRKVIAEETAWSCGEEHFFAAQGQDVDCNPIDRMIRIHFSEWPVNVVLESSLQQGSFLTFFTQDQMTAGTTFHYSLGRETGQTVWEETATAGLWRSDHQLGLAAEQAFELAPALKISPGAEA